MSLVELYMNPHVLTVAPDQTLEQAAQSMNERQVGAVVVTRGSSVVGIVTERDLMRAVARGLVPWSTKIEESMTPDPICITGATDTFEASRIMLDYGFRHLPVLEDERLIGIVSLRDLLKAAEAERVLQAEEEERRRIATEIHDGLTQQVVSIGYRLHACERMLDGDLPAARHELKVAQELIDHALKEARAVIRALRPSSLDELGLLPALEALALWTFSDEVEVLLSADLKVRLPAHLEGSLYRIGQELLSNVRRHAAAGRVELTIDSGKDHVRLRVADDGKGFDLDEYRRARRETSFGLSGIAERVERLGGSLDVQSQIGGGTRVEVSVPLSAAG